MYFRSKDCFSSRRKREGYVFLLLVTFIIYSYIHSTFQHSYIDFYGFLLQQLDDSTNYPSKNLEEHGSYHR